MIDISKKGKGALSKPIALRDYRLELAGSLTLPKKFSVRDKVGKIKDQGGSYSCSAQATSYYAEVLNFTETGDKVGLSPYYLYPFVCYPFEGSYVKDNFQRVCNNGVALESDVPSYENGVPPSEQYMITKPVLGSDIINRAMSYLSKSYFTWDNTTISLYKQAIYQGSGCVVVSWGNNVLWVGQEIGIPDVPSQMEWRHAIYLTGYDDDKQCFEFVNSWGEDWGDKGFGYLPYAYATKGYLTNPMTLIDVPNGTYVSLLSTIRNLLEKMVGLLKIKKNI